jgi:hypothetical protein
MRWEGDVWWVGKNWKVAGVIYFSVLSQHIPEGIEETHENFYQENS